MLVNTRKQHTLRIRRGRRLLAFGAHFGSRMIRPVRHYLYPARRTPVYLVTFIFQGSTRTSSYPQRPSGQTVVTGVILFPPRYMPSSSSLYTVNTEDYETRRALMLFEQRNEHNSWRTTNTPSCSPANPALK